MEQLQPPRGTHDVFGDEARRFGHIVRTAQGVFQRYGFDRLITPTFEHTEVFSRPLGETSDIVSKEMYTFEDRGGNSITLRPEGTAPAVRALISNGLAGQGVQKLYYFGPMFRYERPQKGRYRQHFQIGCELFGVEGPAADVEVLALGYQFLSALGLAEGLQLELNTIGDIESRQTYRKQLVDYFSRYENDLSADSKERLARNPMRILDSKAEQDKKLVADAPLILDALNNHSRAFFEAVQDGLTNLGIAYKVNPHIVRGMDYYTHTCFEYTSNRLGAQATVMGGGRYDGLVEQMGGPATPGVGFGTGVERLMLLTAEQALPTIRPISLLPLDEQSEPILQKLAFDLRAAGVPVHQAYGGNFKKRMKHADKVSATHAVVQGEDERAVGKVLIRNLDSGEQQEVAVEKVVAFFTEAG